MKYYVNKQSETSGHHQLHSEFCGFLPISGNRIYLGNFSKCKEAEVRANKLYEKVTKCTYCCGKES